MKSLFSGPQYNLRIWADPSPANYVLDQFNLAEQQRKLSPQPPVIVGGCLVIPASLLEQNNKEGTGALLARNDRSEAAAMETVMDAVYYIRRPFTKEPSWGVTSENYNSKKLISKGVKVV